MQDEIRITVIATGFEENPGTRVLERKIEVTGLPEEKREVQKSSNYGNEDIDIPTFLRNRFK
jgi:cell division GTPase FtsZ